LLLLLSVGRRRRCLALLVSILTLVVVVAFVVVVVARLFVGQQITGNRVINTNVIVEIETRCETRSHFAEAGQTAAQIKTSRATRRRTASSKFRKLRWHDGSVVQRSTVEWSGSSLVFFFCRFLD